MHRTILLELMMKSRERRQRLASQGFGSLLLNDKVSSGVNKFFLLGDSVRTPSQTWFRFEDGMSSPLQLEEGDSAAGVVHTLCVLARRGPSASAQADCEESLAVSTPHG